MNEGVREGKDTSPFLLSFMSCFVMWNQVDEGRKRERREESENRGRVKFTLHHMNGQISRRFVLNGTEKMVT